MAKQPKQNKNAATNKSSFPAAKKIPDSKKTPPNESKQHTLVTLLKRTGGATIDEMVKVTGWQQHSIRGLISGVLKKRLGLTVTSNTETRGRVYRIAGA